MGEEKAAAGKYGTGGIGGDAPELFVKQATWQLGGVGAVTWQDSGVGSARERREGCLVRG